MENETRDALESLICAVRILKDAECKTAMCKALERDAAEGVKLARQNMRLITCREGCNPVHWRDRGYRMQQTQMICSVCGFDVNTGEYEEEAFVEISAGSVGFDRANSVTYGSYLPCSSGKNP